MALINCIFTVFKVLVLRYVRCLLNIYAQFFERESRDQIPEIKDDVLLKPAVVIADNVRRGKIKSKDVVEAYLRRIEKVNPLINAVVDTNRKAAEEAAAIDEKVRLELEGHEPTDGVSINDMPLIGVPVSIKDLIAVKGLLLTCGLYERRNTVATEDCEVVANLRKAGAIPIVTTNTPEFFTSYDTDTVLTGYTNNPFDLSRSPGGSSGGEGALLSAAGSVIGIGTDVGGSVRIPGIFCGVFGHKPTSLVISNNGLFPEISDNLAKLFTIGPMCRFANDLIPTLKALVGKGIAKLPLIDNEVDLTKVRIFYSFDDKDPYKTPLNCEIKECIRNVVSHFEGKFNVQCVQVNFEEFAVANEVWAKIMKKELIVEYLKYLREKNAYIELIKSFFGLSRHTTRGLLFAIMSQTMDAKVTEEEKRTLKMLRKKYDNLLGSDGVYITPTHPEAAPKRPLTLININNCGYTMPYNVLEAPVTHCPMGLNKKGLPIGVQVAAAAKYDHLTIAVAKEIEKAFHGWVPPCQIKC